MKKHVNKKHQLFKFSRKTHGIIIDDNLVMHLRLKILIISLFLLGIFLPGNPSYTDTLDEHQVNLNIFPNPVEDGSLSINSDIQIKKIEILSIVGQVVLTQELEPSNSVRLYLDQIQSGIYLIKISFINNTSDTKRIWVK